MWYVILGRVEVTGDVSRKKGVVCVIREGGGDCGCVSRKKGVVCVIREWWR